MTTPRKGRRARKRQLVLILDFGSQYTQLIARRVREAGVYCEVRPYDLTARELARLAPDALILSGSPQSAHTPDAYHFDPRRLPPTTPVLGICYGMQVSLYALGGTLHKARHAEFGAVTFVVDRTDALTKGLPRKFRAWMSHGDEVATLPEGFVATGHTANCRFAAARHVKRPWHFIQFHPEVAHTPVGKKLIENFLFRIAHLTADWKIEDFLEEQVAAIRRQVKNGRVVCGLSGGVDSSVVAALVHRAIGDRLTCLFVDHGLLRKNEAEEVTGVLAGHLGLPVVRIDARARFLKALAGVEDPEKKRKIIGREFIRVFEAEAKKLGKVDYLAQGTLYPDVIESASVGKAHVIKSHHNVGGLPARMKLALVEPVRTVGVMGDARTYERVIALRSVTSQDGMTADWGRLPLAFLARVSNRIVNEVRGVSRVVYDISSKPPATIEWE